MASDAHFLATPFRLFFLLATALAVAVAPLWVAFFSGQMRLALPLGPLWHPHEMIYGYAGAVLVGFLLTAARQWTKRQTANMPALAVLLLVWCLARATGVGLLPFAEDACLDTLFFLLAAIALGRPIVLSGKWRNIGFPLLLLLLAGCDAATHLAAHGSIAAGYVVRATWLAVDSVALIILIFAGRVIPLFTKHAFKLTVRQKGALDYLGIGAYIALMLAHAARLSPELQAPLWAAAGLLTVARLYGWGGSHTARSPIFWVLHLGWLLVGLGMLLVAVSMYVTWLSYGAALHLLTVGGFGSLTLGMMARVTLGHTGRERTATKMMTLAFALMLMAMVARVGVSLLPARYFDLLWLAAGLWSASFLLFFLSAAPMLLRPRPDGKPG